MTQSPPDMVTDPTDLADALAVLDAEALSPPGRAALRLLREALLGGTASPLARLTGRQRQVAELLAEGVSNRGLAVLLGISEGTAKLHVAAVLNRLGLSSRDQVAPLLAAARIADPH